MNKLLVLTILLSGPAFSETLKGRIHSIENNILKFENGRVAFLDHQEKLDLSEDDFVEVEIDDRSSLKSIKSVIPDSLKLSSLETDTDNGPGPLFANAPGPFEPTVVQGGMQEAWNIYNRSNPYFKRISECTDRAHVWAHDEFKRNGIKSRKVFALFTASYINSVRFKWWFHVAPLYSVNVNGQVVDLVMDYRYSDGPKTIKEWTDQFVYTKRSCKPTEKFSEFDVNPQTENCYLMIQTMHYRLPGEIFDQERKNLWKVGTSEFEINNARRWAFEK